MGSYLSKKHYLHATNLIVSTLALGEGDLAGVEALKELKSELNSKKQVCQHHFFRSILIHFIGSLFHDLSFFENYFARVSFDFSNVKTLKKTHLCLPFKF